MQLPFIRSIITESSSVISRRKVCIVLDSVFLCHLTEINFYKVFTKNGTFGFDGDVIFKK